MPYPKAIREAPELLPHEIYYFNAYQELSTCRLYDGGFIPWTAVHSYVSAWGGDTDDVEMMSRICHELDELSFADMRERDRNKPTAETGKRTPKRKRIIGD